MPNIPSGQFVFFVNPGQYFQLSIYLFYDYAPYLDQNKHQMFLFRIYKQNFGVIYTWTQMLTLVEWPN